jgi:hypothetical protein
VRSGQCLLAEIVDHYFLKAFKLIPDVNYYLSQLD